MNWTEKTDIDGCDEVHCPICQNGCLRLEAALLLCSNCDLQFFTGNGTLSLMEVNSYLHTAAEEHSTQCAAPPLFNIVQQGLSQLLVLMCSVSTAQMSHTAVHCMSVC